MEENEIVQAANPRAELVDVVLGPAPCQPCAEANEVSQAASLAGMAMAKEARSSGSVHGGNFNVSVFAALTTGATVGIVLRFLSTKPWPSRHVMYLGFPGEILRRLLREAALPLSASSVIAASASLERTLSVRVACFALVYALVVKLAAQANAVLTALAVQPGRALEAGDLQRVLDAVPAHARLQEPGQNGSAGDLLFDVARTEMNRRLFRPVVSYFGLYLFTLVLSLALHSLLMLLLVAASATARTFRGLLHNAATPLAVAFNAVSSSETVPATIAALEERLNLDTKIVRLLIPMAAVFNTDGTAIYITISALFFAQTKSDYVDLRTIFLTCALSMLFSMATPTGGGPSYLRLRLIHEVVGMPTENIGILFVTDWIGSRLATVVDVLTGLIGVHVVQHCCGLEGSPTTEEANRELAH